MNYVALDARSLSGLGKKKDPAAVAAAVAAKQAKAAQKIAAKQAKAAQKQAAKQAKAAAKQAAQQARTAQRAPVAVAAPVSYARSVSVPVPGGAVQVNTTPGEAPFPGSALVNPQYGGDKYEQAWAKTALRYANVKPKASRPLKPGQTPAMTYANTNVDFNSPAGSAWLASGSRQARNALKYQQRMRTPSARAQQKAAGIDPSTFDPASLPEAPSPVALPAPVEQVPMDPLFDPYAQAEQPIYADVIDPYASEGLTFVDDTIYPSFDSMPYNANDAFADDGAMEYYPAYEPGIGDPFAEGLDPFAQMYGLGEVGFLKNVFKGVKRFVRNVGQSIPAALSTAASLALPAAGGVLANAAFNAAQQQGGGTARIAQVAQSVSGPAIANQIARAYGTDPSRWPVALRPYAQYIRRAATSGNATATPPPAPAASKPEMPAWLLPAAVGVAALAVLSRK